MIKFLFFILLCIWAGYYDLRYKIIPNFITLPGIIAGIILTYIYNDITLINSVTAGITGFIFFYSIYLIGRKFYNKEVIGGGDIKLIAMIGIFTGINSMLKIIFYASGFGILVTLGLVLFHRVTLKDEIPFGFYLAITALATVLFYIS